MHRGFIKLHRKLQDWEWKTKPNTVALFIHLLISANHSDNNYQGTAIKRGQTLTGRKKLSIDTGLSEQQIRTSLNHLKSTKDITIKPTKKYSIITITNWDLYQCTNQQTNQAPTNNQPSDNHKQECKELKNDKKSIKEKDFEEFWSLCPKKVGKGDARNKYIKALEKISHDELLIAIKSHKEEMNVREKKYIPNPATWLHQERYLDEQSVIKDVKEHKTLMDFGGDFPSYKKYINDLNR